MRIKTTFAVALLLCSLILSVAQTALATVPDARKTLERSVTEILNIIKNPAYSSEASRAPLRASIEEKVSRIFDFDEFSSRTVGINWKSFSPAQKQNFINAFADLLKATYLDKIDGYNGEQITYNGEISNDAKDRVEVRTSLILKNGSALPVAYRMMLKNNTWVVYDVLIEGVSMVKNYRTQFQDILGRGTPEQLTERVKAKAVEVRSSEKIKK